MNRMKKLLRSTRALTRKDGGFFCDIFIINIIFLILATVFYSKLFPLYYYPAWDQAHHLLVAGGYFEAIERGSMDIFWDMLFNSHTIYPPLFHLSVAIGYSLFGIQDKIALLVNFPYMLLLGVSTYLLGRLVTNRLAAFSSGVLVFFVPLFINLWTDAMTDISSVALFITLYWVVLKTDYFRLRYWSIASGVVALGLLLARYAFFNAAIPLVVYAGISIKKTVSWQQLIFFAQSSWFSLQSFGM